MRGGVALLLSVHLARREGVADGLALGSLPRSEAVYEGSLFGVRARASLYERQGFAELELRGLAVGGRLRGFAWLADGAPRGGSDCNVTLDHVLERRLHRRLVRVVSAHRAAASDTLSVTLVLPVVGTHTVALERTRKH